MNILRINTFYTTDEKANELFLFLQSIVPYIKSSTGCLNCELFRSLENKEQFVIIEKWDSIEAHKSSIQNFPKEQMQSVMSLFSKPPEGMYYHI